MRSIEMVKKDELGDSEIYDATQSFYDEIAEDM